jgi:hypothetical protein
MSRIKNGKVGQAIAQPDTGWTPVNGGGHYQTPDDGELDRTRDAVRAQYQLYLDARSKHGIMPIILIPANGGKYLIFAEDAYTASQYAPVTIIPGLYHHAVIDQAAAGKLQAAGHQVVYANQTGGPRER